VLATNPYSISHDFGSVPEKETRTWTFDITNVGKGTLTWATSSNQPWLTYKTGTATFQYRPGFYAFAGVAPDTTIGAEASVLLRTDNEREAFRPGSHRHPIEAITESVGRPFHPGDDPYNVREWNADSRGRRTPWDPDWFKDTHPRP